MLERSAEAPRDLQPSGFTPILRALFQAEPQILAAVFVDSEGECVDYCSSLNAYDTKIAGACLWPVMSDVQQRVEKLDCGLPEFVQIFADERELLVRRVSEDYVLVVVVLPAGTVRRLLEAVERAVRLLQVEAGMAPPSRPDTLVVETRAAKGWSYAPTQFIENGVTMQIAAVLGRWIEGGPVTGADLVCFRVRTDSGEELTLAHDASSDGWERR